MKLDMMWQVGGGSVTVMNPEKMKMVESYIESRVGDFRCPDHNEAPTVICQGQRLDALTFDVKACCQKAVHLVRRLLEE